MPILARQWLNIAVAGTWMFGKAPQEVRIWIVDKTPYGHFTTCTPSRTQTGCRMLLPRDPPLVIPGDAKSLRLAEKIAEARAKGDSSLLAKMWAYMGLYSVPYNIFDFRVSRHRDGPDDFFPNSRCIVQGDCFSGNLSVVLHSEDRLTFSACW